MTPPLDVTGWVWTTTTVVGAVVTVTLLVVLGAHVLVAAISPAGRTRAWDTSVIRRRLERGAIPLAAGFAAVVIVRFVLILVEHHGP